MTESIPAEPSADPMGNRLWRGVWAGVREVFIVLLLAMGLSLLVKTFLVQPFHIPSGSMEDTLIKDDRVVVSKLTPGPFALARGDIVVFTDPDHWLGDIPAPSRSPLKSALIFTTPTSTSSNESSACRVTTSLAAQQMAKSASTMCPSPSPMSSPVTPREVDARRSTSSSRPGRYG